MGGVNLRREPSGQAAIATARISRTFTAKNSIGPRTSRSQCGVPAGMATTSPASSSCGVPPVTLSPVDSFGPTGRGAEIRPASQECPAAAKGEHQLRIEIVQLDAGGLSRDGAHRSGRTDPLCPGRAGRPRERLGSGASTRRVADADLRAGLAQLHRKVTDHRTDLAEPVRRPVRDDDDIAARDAAGLAVADAASALLVGSQRARLGHHAFGHERGRAVQHHDDVGVEG